MKCNKVTEITTLLLTILICLISYFQLGDMNRTSKADFTYRFNNDFTSNNNYEEIIILIENNLLSYIENDKDVPRKLQNIVHFKYNGGTNNIIKYKQYYNDYEISDLLSNFEVVGLYVKNGLLDIEDTYEIYDYDIILIWENKEIQKFVRMSRKEENSDDIFSNCEFLYNHIKEYKSLK